MVEAVPMVMQVPAERAMPASMSFHCWLVMLPASFSAQYFQTSEPEPRMLPPQVAAHHRPGRHEDHRQVHAMRAHEVPGVVLSQPPSRTAPSTGCERSNSSASMARKLR